MQGRGYFRETSYEATTVSAESEKRPNLLQRHRCQPRLDALDLIRVRGDACPEMTCPVKPTRSYSSLHFMGFSFNFATPRRSKIFRGL